MNVLPLSQPVDPGRWRALAAYLREAGYGTKALHEVLALDGPPEAILADVARCSLINLNRLAKQTSTLSITARLFLLCGAVPARELVLLKPELRELLRELDLIRPDPRTPESVRARVAITEYAGRYFCSDRLFENVGDGLDLRVSEGICMPLHASSLELLSTLRKRTPAESFLDVGCGTGCQAIVFAARYDKVLGFDINPRCTAYASINSLMNKVPATYQTCGWRDFHAEEPFQHVAFNAPDVATAFAFIADGCQRVLAPGGLAQVLTSFEVGARDGDASDAVRRRLRLPDGLELAEVAANADSPFALSRRNVAEGRLPRNSLLVPNPSQRAGYLRSLAERGVVEVVSATLSLQRR